ncbi:N-acetylmuramoyl-L-alanine amidase [Heyndrickxia acidiproducens]|uniref:N-acetylmuramoyl-L-alanine amidase n=1 Tax=Heyndrickxia acidiproducens TaxID=1121084 RepID=UPI00036B0C16|nr:N-acetylmuramoyl-L-alanine amidase [Heyndrickxia acidiproducens]
MKKKICVILFCLLVFLASAAAVKTEAKASTTITVNQEMAHIRSGPGLDYGIAGQAGLNDTFNVLDEKNGWYQIQLSAGKSGWIAGWLVEKNRSGNAADTNSESISAAIVAVSQLNVRESPSLSSATIASTSYGTRLQIVDTKRGWYQVRLADGTLGWVAGYYVEQEQQAQKEAKGDQVMLLQDQTNLRSSPSLSASVLATGDAGETYPVLKQSGDWYEIQINGGTHAYVASWLVQKSTAAGRANQKKPGIKGKTIVLDPGHGGEDHGTTGYSGTLEKVITLKTVDALYGKLKKAGARVILTRRDDSYVSLPQRVEISNTNRADAFVSIHFDSSQEVYISGHTTYYFHRRGLSLANIIDKQLSNSIRTHDRGVKFGDYHVIRENKQPAILLELGYLSNPQEEQMMLSKAFQRKAVAGIYNGLQEYFQ